MNKPLNVELEKAVRLLVKYFPVSDENTRKPVLFHDIRVGVYLYENNYSDDIVLAGLLHDTLEFSDITEQMLRDEFGDNIADLVKANSKNRSITDPDQRIDELIKRCAASGKDALVIKAADIIDSFKYYESVNNQDELKNYCIKNADAIFKYKPADYNDVIFDELKNWQNKFLNIKTV